MGGIVNVALAAAIVWIGLILLAMALLGDEQG